MLAILNLTYGEFLAKFAELYGRGSYHANSLYRALLQDGKLDIAKLKEFQYQPDLAKKIMKDISFPNCEVRKQISEDGVTKFIITLGDDKIIESVLIPAKGRITLCISSQVGCRMACTFCETAKLGLQRNLTAEEIVWQLYAARFILKSRVDNIVFMGMGEPLDNINEVYRALQIFNDQRGFDVAYRHITISTSGNVKGLAEFANFALPNLRWAISLNAANDELRSKLMPINRHYPLAILKEALQAYPLEKRGIFLLEYVLLVGVNDSEKDSAEIAEFAGNLPVRINLIAYNGDKEYQTPTSDEMNCFAKSLIKKGLFVYQRRSRGDKIAAACGQLAGKINKQ